jgi:hypothetical protein
LRALVERQYAQVREAHDRIRNLERALSGTSGGASTASA